MAAQKTTGLKARFSCHARFSPRHSARRIERRACAASRGILPETFERDGALLVFGDIVAPSRANLGSPKTRRIRVAGKSRDIEGQGI